MPFYINQNTESQKIGPSETQGGGEDFIFLKGMIS